ncbi:MAG: MarR family transcriptional regulator [Candidatus Bathyarchaeota archaeon]|nr:MarR family transcriptional regulator [Candidatus Bathyarchaeota archaeon]
MRHEYLNAENELRAIEKRLVEIIVNLGYFKGRSRRTSKILAYFYIYNEVTQKMLRQATGYSLGTVSNALKELRQLGLIHKSRSPEQREYSYELVVPMSQQLTYYSKAMNRYFQDWNEFLKHLENKLLKNQIAKKKGAESIRNFINKMRLVILAAANAMRTSQFTIPESQQEVTDK